MWVRSLSHTVRRPDIQAQAELTLVSLSRQDSIPRMAHSIILRVCSARYTASLMTPPSERAGRCANAAVILWRKV